MNTQGTHMAIEEGTATAQVESSASEWRSGWRTLAAATTGMGLGWGLFLMTAGLFIVPMEEEFGWSRSALSIGPMAHLLSAFIAPFSAIMVDRYGARNIAIAGLGALALLYLLLSVVTDNPWLFYAIAVFLAFIGTLTSGIVFCKGVANWFFRNAGLAFGITNSGVSITAAIMLPALGFVIERFGWRAGYLTLASSILFLALPIVIGWFKERLNQTIIESAQSKSNIEKLDTSIQGFNFREAVRDKKFWMLCVSLGLAAFPVGGFMSQLHPLLVNQGFSPMKAASVLTGFALGIGSGRLVVGFLLDRFNPSKVAGASLVLPALGALILALTAGDALSSLITSSFVIYFVVLAVFMIGLGQGAEVDFIMFFALRLFGMKNYAVISSAIAVAVASGIALGGILFAGIYDVFGGYQMAIYSSIALYLLASTILIRIKVPPHSG